MCAGPHLPRARRLFWVSRATFGLLGALSATPQFPHRGCQNVAHPLSFRDSSWDGNSSSASHQVVGQTFCGIFTNFNTDPQCPTTLPVLYPGKDLMHNGALEPCPDTPKLWIKIPCLPTTTSTAPPTSSSRSTPPATTSTAMTPSNRPPVPRRPAVTCASRFWLVPRPWSSRWWPAAELSPRHTRA